MNTEGSGGLAAVVRALVLPAYIPVLCLAFAWSLLIPAFPQYLSGLGAGVAATGLIIAMKGVGQVASDLPGGLVLARLGLRRVVLSASALTVAANVALALTVDIAVITVLTFASGFFSSILLTGVMTTVRRTVMPEFRGRALSGVGGSLRVGMLLGPVIGGLLADRYGVPTIFLLRSAILTIGTLAFYRGTPAARAPVRTPGHGSTLTELRAGLKGRWYAVVTVGFAILVLSLLRASREIIFPLWGAELALSPTLIGAAVSLGAALDLLLFIPAGVISDRWGRRSAISLCLGGFAAGLFLMRALPTVPGFVAGVAIVGVGNGLGSGINMTTGTDLAPDRAISEFLGAWRLYGDIGTAMGPVLVGLLTASLTLGPAIVLTGIAGLAGLLVTLGLTPETRDIVH